jgi:hypothetical protein
MSLCEWDSESNRPARDIQFPEGREHFGCKQADRLGLDPKKGATIMEEMVTITKKEYEGLVEDSRKLAALEAAGVDNWQGYDDAMEIMAEIS